MTALLLAVCAVGCADVTSVAIPTSGRVLPPRTGPVAVYAAYSPPSGARELGVIDVRAPSESADLQKLFDELIQRTLDLGGNAVAIDWMGAKIELVSSMMTTSMMMCGRVTCVASTMPPPEHEVMTVLLHGRALFIEPSK